MRNRSISGVLVLALGLIALPALASPALAAPAARAAVPASCGGDYPPHGPAIEGRLALASVSLLPGASGTIVLQGAVPGGAYSGSLFPKIVDLPATSATGGGAVTFSNIAVPGDFQVSAAHHLDVYRDCNLVGAFDFCVTGAGSMAPVASCTTAVAAAKGAAANADASGSLPRTGWDHLLEVLRLATLLLGIGVFLMYLRRRAAVRPQP